MSLLERGKNSASIRVVFKLCAVLRLSPSAFMARVENRIEATERK